LASKKYSPTPAASDRWQINFRDPESGKRTSRIFYGSESAADRECRRWEAALEYQKQHRREFGSTTTFEKASTEFLDIRLKTVSAETYKHDRRAIEQIGKVFTTESNIDQLKMKHIEQLKATMLNANYGVHVKIKYKEAGINLLLRHLKHFLRWCRDMEYIQRVPKFTMLQEPQREILWHTKEEISAIIAASDHEPTQDLIRLFVLTGARTMELIKAKASYYSKTESRLEVPAATAKSRIKRYLYLNAEAKQIVESYIKGKKSHHPIFDLTRDGFASRYGTACTRAQIKSSPHALRRTAGAWLILGGVDIYRVSKWLGHSSVVVTEKYYVDILPQDYHNSSNFLILL